MLPGSESESESVARTATESLCSSSEPLRAGEGASLINRNPSISRREG